MTPAQAAKHAGVSRWTIMRAISGDAANAAALPARRDNRNRWQIMSDDLDAWLAQRAHTVRAQDGARQDAPSDEGQQDREELVSLRVEVRMLRDGVEAAERDRDAWRDEASDWKRQTQELTSTLATRRRRWWPWR